MVTRQMANEHKKVHEKSIKPIPTIEEIEHDLDMAIFKAIRNNTTPWVEAILPYYINERMIEKIFEKYKDSGWYSILAKSFTETKCEDGGFSTNYRVVSYTKFIFCEGAALEHEMEKFYGKDLKDPTWKVFDSNMKLAVGYFAFENM